MNVINANGETLNLNLRINMIGYETDGLIVKYFDSIRTHPNGTHSTMWGCECKNCGTIFVVNGHDLRSGHTTTCRKCSNIGKRWAKDKTGEVHGWLTVLERGPDYIYNNTTSPRWWCRCICGNIILVQGGNLDSGATTSCGCKSIGSKGEEKITEILTNLNVKFRKEYSFEDFKNKGGRMFRFDFAILNQDETLKALIEYQGLQHYKTNGTFGKYQRFYSDPLKKEYCIKNNITLYEIRYDENIEEKLTEVLQDLSMTIPCQALT